MSQPHPHPRKFPTTSDDTRCAFLHSDREDLLAVLTLRFGPVPESVQTRIAACDDAATLERWILVAANVPDWVTFLSDLDAGPNAFRLVGASYKPNPIGLRTGSDASTRRAREPREPRLPDGTRPKKEE